jgi:hypothetical protein
MANVLKTLREKYVGVAEGDTNTSIKSENHKDLN